jgi:hypothetical protein
VTIVDFKGFKMSEAWGEGLEFAKRLAQLLGAQFPERAVKVFLINTPVSTHLCRHHVCM